mmetsp:Transcript_42398/g.83309  ORF Transcript_42398/g.83309 Transcript_42398/m.83309 type:complete len:562 (-) Transcript_42398:219-1904(-)|eukprot:CAMPEP_0194323496 /NCGR_PEP_ID=MMETSP0171-20130528/25780_1 /TAXON_ID=218684 /ORGANISM="Corethron pennatum, Strain L29A3" /LENGTH=561 /DNA_ID=CAMNT_0039082155 /DNA_START=164 /DNA_END=1849 /DNA_ORIENTATION=-
MSRTAAEYNNAELHLANGKLRAKLEKQENYYESVIAEQHDQLCAKQEKQEKYYEVILGLEDTIEQQDASLKKNISKLDKLNRKYNSLLTENEKIRRLLQEGNQSSAKKIKDMESKKNLLESHILDLENKAIRREQLLPKVHHKLDKVIAESQQKEEEYESLIEALRDAIRLADIVKQCSMKEHESKIAETQKDLCETQESLSKVLKKMDEIERVSTDRERQLIASEKNLMKAQATLDGVFVKVNEAAVKFTGEQKASSEMKAKISALTYEKDHIEIDFKQVSLKLESVTQSRDELKSKVEGISTVRDMNITTYEESLANTRANLNKVLIMCEEQEKACSEMKVKLSTLKCEKEHVEIDFKQVSRKLEFVLQSQDESASKVKGISTDQKKQLIKCEKDLMETRSTLNEVLIKYEKQEIACNEMKERLSNFEEEKDHVEIDLKEVSNKLDSVPQSRDQFDSQVGRISTDRDTQLSTPEEDVVAAQEEATSNVEEAEHVRNIFGGYLNDTRDRLTQLFTYDTDVQRAQAELKTLENKLHKTKMDINERNALEAVIKYKKRNMDA